MNGPKIVIFGVWVKHGKVRYLNMRVRNVINENLKLYNYKSGFPSFSSISLKSTEAQRKVIIDEDHVVMVF